MISIFTNQMRRYTLFQIMHPAKLLPKSFETCKSCPYKPNPKPIVPKPIVPKPKPIVPKNLNR